MYVNWFNNICDVFISYNTKRFDKNQIFLYYYFVITINFRIYDNYFSSFILIALIALSTAINATPTSANTASHMLETPPAIAAKVRTGELDIGFGGYLKKEDMEFFPLSAQELVIITPKKHPLAGIREVPLSEMNHYPVIGYEKESWMGTYAKYLYRKYQIEPNMIVECPDEYSIVSLVRENFGIALMPQTDILLDADGINIHKLKGLQIYRQVFMFWMKDRYRLPAVERFINYMKEQQAEDANDTENVSKVYLKDIVNF